MEPSVLEVERIVAERQQVTKRFLEALTPVPESVETVFEFELSEQNYVHHESFEITRVRAKRIVMVAEAPYVCAEGYGWPLTMSGRRRANGSPQWLLLPSELAEAVMERMERA